MDFDHIQIQGHLAEEYVMDKIYGLGFNVRFVNSYYDLEILNDENPKKVLWKVEVKSTSFLLNNGTGKRTYGRFDFTEKKNRSLQRSNNVIYVFVLCVKDKFEIIGCSRAKTINAQRYVTLKKLMNEYYLKSLEKMFTLKNT